MARALVFQELFMQQYVTLTFFSSGCKSTVYLQSAFQMINRIKKKKIHFALQVFVSQILSLKSTGLGNTDMKTRI